MRTGNWIEMRICSTVLLMMLALIGCGSGERVRNETEMYDYLKSVEAEEKDHFQQNTVSNAPAGGTDPAASTSQFFPEDRRN